MKEEIANQIIRETCSKSLQAEINRRAFKVKDFDLLLLAYKHSPDYNKKLELLKLIQESTDDVPTREQAKKCISYEKDKWSRFIEYEKDCVFEVKIKYGHSAPEEVYLAKTYDGALNKVKFFYEYYKEGCKMTEESRFSIAKRNVADEKSAEDFKNDWRGEAKFKAYDVLIDVRHNDLRESVHYNGIICDLKCDDCTRSCFPYIAPKLPRFLKNLDAVCYDDDGAKKYLAVFFVNGASNPEIDEDECAYCVDLDNDICSSTIKTTEAFYGEVISGLHTHVEYPYLEIISPDDLPDDKKVIYKTLLKLFKKYGDN